MLVSIGVILAVYKSNIYNSLSSQLCFLFKIQMQLFNCQILLNYKYFLKIVLNEKIVKHQSVIFSFKERRSKQCLSRVPKCVTITRYVSLYVGHKTIFQSIWLSQKYLWPEIKIQSNLAKKVSEITRTFLNFRLSRKHI